MPTRKNDEHLAKAILSKLVSQDFEQLELRDKPDFQFPDHSKGIEVTRAIGQKQQEAEHLYLKLMKKMVRDDKGTKKRIEDCGGTFYGEILGTEEMDSFSLILQALQKKLDTINRGGYVVFEHYDLFIFSEIYIYDTLKEQALESMLKISENYELWFEKVIVSVPGNLCIFDLFLKQIRNIEYQNDMGFEIANMQNYE